MDFWVSLRLLILVGCLASLAVLASAHFRQWKSWNAKTRDHWFALSGWVFLGFYSTIENLLQKNSGGSRLILMLLVIAFTMRALSRPGELSAHSTTLRKERSK